MRGHGGNPIVRMLARPSDCSPIQDIEGRGIVEEVPVFITRLSIEPGNGGQFENLNA